MVSASDAAGGPRRRALPRPTPAAAASRRAEQDQIIDFSADQVTYDSDADVVTASGAVRMSRDGNYRRRRPGHLEPQDRRGSRQGNVVMLTPQGDKLIGDNVALTDTLRDGTIDNLLVVLESGGAHRGAPAAPAPAMSPRSRMRSTRPAR